MPTIHVPTALYLQTLAAGLSDATGHLTRLAIRLDGNDALAAAIGVSYEDAVRSVRFLHDLMTAAERAANQP